MHRLDHTPLVVTTPAADAGLSDATSDIPRLPGLTTPAEDARLFGPFMRACADFSWRGARVTAQERKIA